MTTFHSCLILCTVRTYYVQTRDYLPCENVALGHVCSGRISFFFGYILYQFKKLQLAATSRQSNYHPGFGSQGFGAPGVWSTLVHASSCCLAPATSTSNNFPPSGQTGDYFPCENVASGHICSERLFLFFT